MLLSGYQTAGLVSCCDDIRAGSPETLADHVQIKYVKGWGKFKSDTEVEVDLLDGGTAAISAKNYLIATGSEVTSLPNVPIDEDRCVHHAVLCWCLLASVVLRSPSRWCGGGFYL